MVGGKWSVVGVKWSVVSGRWSVPGRWSVVLEYAYYSDSCWYKSYKKISFLISEQDACMVCPFVVCFCFMLQTHLCGAVMMQYVRIFETPQHLQANNSNLTKQTNFTFICIVGLVGYCRLARRHCWAAAGPRTTSSCK